MSLSTGTEKIRRRVRQEQRATLSFRDFLQVLDNRKFVNIYSTTEDVDNFIADGKVRITVGMYDFGNGIRIFRERHDENGHQSVRTRGFPTCSYETRHYSHVTDYYFVESDGKPVTGRAEVIHTIKDATGVRLATLESGKPHFINSNEPRYWPERYIVSKIPKYFRPDYSFKNCEDMPDKKLNRLKERLQAKYNIR